MQWNIIQLQKGREGGTPQQWLGLLASAAGGVGSLPGWGSKIRHAVQCDQNK